jgi:hypothetical protein
VWRCAVALTLLDLYSVVVQYVLSAVQPVRESRGRAAVVCVLCLLLFVVCRVACVFVLSALQ